MSLNHYDRGAYWRAERLMPTVTFTGTPLIPYIIAEPGRGEWEREYTRVLHEAERCGWPRRGGEKLHRFTGLRHAIGGAVIWTGERIAGAKSAPPVSAPAGDLRAAH